MFTVTANLNERIALPGLGLQRAWVTCTICLLAVFALVSPTISQWLQFDRWEIQHRGEDWRILTGHVVHWNANHFIWDAAMFVILGILCERRDRVRFIICLFVSAVAISLSVYYLLPEVTFYRGLSGIDSALFTLASVLLFRDAYRHQDRFVMGLFCIGLAGLTGKLVFEIVTGTTLFVDSATAGFTPLPLVHAVGAVVGIVSACFSMAGIRLRQNYITTSTLGNLFVPFQPTMSQMQKSKRRWYQFSLKQMLGATTCFGVAFASAAWAKLIFADAFMSKWRVLAAIIAILYFFPPFAAGMGAGIGTLCNHFWRGLLIGTVVGFIPWLLLIAAVSWHT